jgi:DNA-binding NarL/FixJ family response regulator
MAGVLVVARAAELHTEYKAWLEQFGFADVTITCKRNDTLNTVINNVKPHLVIFDSGFYQGGTSVRIGELLKLFPKLNIAVVSLDDFPLTHAPWFIWEGAKSYLSLWEGYGEFRRGLQLVRDGKQYISPKVQKLIDRCDEWPDTKNKMTKRMRECLIMLCCGLIRGEPLIHSIKGETNSTGERKTLQLAAKFFIPDEMGEALNIERRTVYRHLDRLYAAFHVGSREEMIALALEMELVTAKDMRFYSRRKERQQMLSEKELPQWAVVKRKLDMFGDYC